MPADSISIRKCLADFDFQRLLVDELGWNRHRVQPLVVRAGNTQFTLAAVAEKCGMAVLVHESPEIPAYPLRRKIEQQVRKYAHEHLIVFTDAAHSTQVWQWVKREAGGHAACREHRYNAGQTGQALVEKLERLAFELEEEERLTITEVTARARAALDVERVTKRFYDRFKREHDAFRGLIEGIEDRAGRDWYASLMLNRMMFVYFIQKRGFLADDPDYLRNRLRMVQESRGKGKFLSFYRYFLLRLFHEGLGKPVEDRTGELGALLGRVPYLNGGLFDVHELEREYGEIDIPDEAFEGIFDFFDAYTWHLDERPLRADNEINPDVLGYIFEKYINQKQMGAYYTKEDITGYITRNTVIPYLFDAARKECTVAFKPDAALWRLLRDDPDRYIYPAVKSGVIVDEPSRLVSGLTSRDGSSTMHDSSAQYFDPEDPVDNLSGNLPHWRQGGVAYFVTFRLADSIPADKLRQWLAERDAWLRDHPEPHDAKARAAYYRLFPRRLQEWLDSGHGSCVLADPGIREMVENALRHFDGARYLLDEFVVMPNHVHAIVTPIAPHTLSEILHSWKSFTSHAINERSAKSGANWQQESFDHIIRNEASLERIRQYIRDNPRKIDEPAIVDEPSRLVSGLTSRDGSSTIYPESSLPEFVREGMHDPKKRMFDQRYNLTQAVVPGPDGQNLALPTETWREYVERRTRCLNLRAKLAAGEVHTIDDFITLNLDIERFAEDVIVNSEGPELVRAFWNALTGISILDPTCGSGAFLFAALNILEPLYNACLEGMQGFLDDLARSGRKHSPKKLEDFRKVLAEMDKHPNRRYFILKSITLNNLYGVDIMDEAVEICKLRLFLKLVAQVERVEQIEPLPDIDFNVRAGNTLVGYASLEQMREAALTDTESLANFNTWSLHITEQAEIAERAFNRFHEMQTKHDMDATAFSNAKAEVRARLDALRDELDKYLAKEYGIVDEPSRLVSPAKQPSKVDEPSRLVHPTNKPSRVDEPSRLVSPANQPSQVDEPSRLVLPLNESSRLAPPTAPPTRRADATKQPSRRTRSMSRGGEFATETSRDGSSTFSQWRESHKPFHWFVEFYGIIKAGGFDAVIGNPPYVEYRKASQAYEIRQYQTLSCSNLWAYVLERSFSLISDRGGMALIVPLSLVSAEKMLPCFNLLRNAGGQTSFLTLSGDAHPSVLFDGVKMSFTIVTHRCSETAHSTMSVTKLYRWLAEERPHLFPCVSYVPALLEISFERPAKINGHVGREVLRKMCSRRQTLGSQTVPDSRFRLLYHRIVRHFVKCVLNTPYFWNERDGEKKSEDYKEIFWSGVRELETARAVLVSSAYYVFFLAFSDSYHCGRELVLGLPADLGRMGKDIADRLASLGKKHEEDLFRNSKRRRIEYRATGWIEYDEFYPRLSKPIVDEIDAVLARHYGFTEDELDFIINYEIKYRMGLSNTEDTENNEDGAEEGEA